MAAINHINILHRKAYERSLPGPPGIYNFAQSLNRASIDECASEADLSGVQSTGISQLPAEVLEEILYQTLDDDVGSRAIFALELVCRCWRNLALGNGKLWSWIVINNRSLDGVHLVRRLLHRSRGESLDVRLSQTMEESPPHVSAGNEGGILPRMEFDVVQLLLRELPRIRTLHLSLSGNVYNDYASLLMVHAPQLKTLALSLAKGTLRPHRTALELPLSLPVNSVQFPALSTISAYGLPAGYGLSLLCSAYSTLTHFKLRAPYGLPQVDPEKLLFALKSMTKLSTLDLVCHVISRPQPSLLDTPMDDMVAHLPSLRTLRLVGEVSHFNWVLSHLKLSPLINLDLSIIGAIDTLDVDYIDLGTRIFATLYPDGHNSSLAPLQHGGVFWTPSQEIYHDNPTPLHFILSESKEVIQDYASIDSEFKNMVKHSNFDNWEEVEAIADAARSCVPNRDTGSQPQRILHLWMLDELTERSAVDRVELIWGVLPLHDVQVLTLRGIPEDSGGDDNALAEDRDGRKLLLAFMDYVSRMTSVRHLVLHDWDQDWITLLINSPLDTSERDNRHHNDSSPRRRRQASPCIVFPSLETIVVCAGPGTSRSCTAESLEWRKDLSGRMSRRSNLLRHYFNRRRHLPQMACVQSLKDRTYYLTIVE
ncbi:hypothetical protein BXZ70DRAFT_1079311 [Cristinia sonorae]|uniref:F-box domain-containing protein n=1 Tax=Cristinia sonorae TaxID=1940300 RepID=A0A8K0UJF9_9AGAR|nr:hypothetical protein BXZ70DRAFT_1079311 [Cristinia sonorae]